MSVTAKSVIASFNILAQLGDQKLYLFVCPCLCVITRSWSFFPCMSLGHSPRKIPGIPQTLLPWEIPGHGHFLPVEIITGAITSGVSVTMQRLHGSDEHFTFHKVGLVYMGHYSREVECFYINLHFAANLFEKRYAKFHQNRHSFVEDITNNILILFWTYRI